MNKRILFLMVVCMFIVNVSGISSNLADSYQPSETVIVQIAGNILEPILFSQVEIKKVNQAVGVEGDVVKVGDNYYIWFIAPSNVNTYTLVIEDVYTTVGGVPEIIDFSEDFDVIGDIVDYSVNPGAIFETDNFNVVVNLYEDFDKVISVDFPSAREFTLVPGAQNIYFSVDEIIGTQITTINIGHYAIPAYVVGTGVPDDGEDEPPSEGCNDGNITGEEVCECGDDEECGTEDDDLNGKTCVGLGYDSGDLYCKDGCTNFNVGGCVSEDNGGDDNGGGDENGVIDRNYFFRFNPRAIRSTVLISEPMAKYRFGIINLGDEVIEGMMLEYDEGIFLIEPSGGINVEVNETVYFSLSLRGFDEEIREVVKASAEGYDDYLLINVEGTENVEEVEVEYEGEEREDEPLYYCSELGGMGCTGGEVCSGETRVTIDESSCCVGDCEELSSGGSLAWVGWLIAGIVVVGLLIVYFKYKKTGKEKKPLERRVGEVEKNMP